jgi:hypothetical protein
MIRPSVAPAPVKARLLVDTVVDKISRAKGDIVELSACDFKYLFNLNRVEAAPAVKAK